MRPLFAFVLFASLSGCAAQSSAPDGPSAVAGPPLVGTTWIAFEIDGAPVTAADPKQQPNLLLSSADSRLTGSTGCNRVAGPFTQEGSTLRFGTLISTRVACIPDRGPTERAFLAALEATTSHAIVGGTLELRDGAGVVRMRLRAP